MNFGTDRHAGDPLDAIDELARLFAMGVVRLRQSDAKSPDSGVHGLALCSDSCPAVVDGVESRRKDQA
jgi:hypothetical protein